MKIFVRNIEFTFDDSESVGGMFYIHRTYLLFFLYFSLENLSDLGQIYIKYPCSDQVECYANSSDYEKKYYYLN